jgi:YesN/AraC family two-component response regulator
VKSKHIDEATLNVLQELTVDIVLTDYCMPEMTGYDLLKAIKVTRLLATLRVDFNFLCLALFR